MVLTIYCGEHVIQQLQTTRLLFTLFAKTSWERKENEWMSVRKCDDDQWECEAMG